MVKTNVTRVTHVHTWSQTGKILFLTCLAFHICAYMLLIHACMSSHSQIQLIKWEKLFKEMQSSPPQRQEGAQVADGRWDMYVWKNPSTVKQHEVLRQSLTAATPELLFICLVLSSPVQLRLSSGSVKKCCHLVVDWWNYNQGQKTKGEKRKKKKGGEGTRGPVFTW